MKGVVVNPYTNSVSIFQYTEHVYINNNRLADCARQICTEDLQTPNWRDSVFPEDDKLFVEFIGVANAINFCFTDPWTRKKFDVEYKGKIYSGSYAMAASLMRALDKGYPILDPDFLSDLRVTTVQKIFEHANNPIPLLNERVDHLQNVGRVLKKLRMNFMQLIERCAWEAFNRGFGIVEQLVQNFWAYRDVTLYRGHFLNFAKRAQLMVMVYNGRALDSDVLIALNDPWQIGPISDYAVPVILRDEGILVYEKSLQDDVDNGRVIPGESDKEIAIRIQTINAIRQLVDLISEMRGRMIHMGQLDYYLWSRGRKSKSNHHLTPTTAY